MARFYLHLHECGTTTLDDEGIDRPDLSSVRQAAILAARGVMEAEIRDGHLCLLCHIEVRDEQQCVVMIVPFREAVTVTGLD